MTKPGEAHQGAVASETPFRLYYLGFDAEQARGLEADFYLLGKRRVVADQEGRLGRACRDIVAEVRGEQPYHAPMV